jgi:hypothetical protein
VNTPLLMLLAAALLTAAGYAQYRIPFHTASRARATLTRAILAFIGLAVGWLSVRYANSPQHAGLAFLCGFGVVHVPAAFILFLKRARGERPS